MSALTLRWWQRGAALALWLASVAGTALAAEISVLSAGAVEPGLRPALAAFDSATGDHIVLKFAAAPRIRPELEAGTVFDLVIAPPAVLDELASAGKVEADRSQRVMLGRVGVGVAVAPGAARPDIATAEAFRRALLAADSVVYNRASTGLYIESLLKREGIAEQIAPKTTRYGDGAAVMAHVLKGHGREIGIGATTEILLLRDQGLQLVGPLPAELQNFTSYAAMAVKGARNAAGAQALLRHLASPAVRAGFVAAGVDPAL